jgi:hypothetical protein
MFKSSQAKKASSLIRKKGDKKPKKEYWFLSDALSKGQQQEPVRVKFVNTDDYIVVKGREGWVDVKESGKIKPCFVVLKEDTLHYYKDPKDPKPLGSVADVSACEITTKPGLLLSKLTMYTRIFTLGLFVPYTRCDSTTMSLRRAHDKCCQGRATPS